MTDGEDRARALMLTVAPLLEQLREMFVERGRPAMHVFVLDADEDAATLLPRSTVVAFLLEAREQDLARQVSAGPPGEGYVHVLVLSAAGRGGLLAIREVAGEPTAPPGGMPN